MFQVDLKEMVVRLIKYLVEGLAVAIAAHYIPKNRAETNLNEIMMIGITAAATFAILDMAAPSVSIGARFGAGFEAGRSLVM
jgi:ABC-type Co2+ transport system permease subunit